MAKRRRKTSAGASALPRVAPLAMLAMLLSPQSHAALKFTPSVGLTETYTDNVNLERRELAKGQFVTDIAPALSIVDNGPRLKLSAAYQLHYFAYSDQQLPNTATSRHQYQADMKAKLVGDLLFLDAFASRGQQSISAFGPQLSNNFYSSANQTEVSTYRISPYLRHRFGTTADLGIRYTRDSVSSGLGANGDSKGDSLALDLSSGPSFHALGWGVNVRREDLDNSISGKSVSETAQANLRYRLSPSLSLTGSGGYDKYDYDTLGGRTQGKSWSAGFIWTPSPRTSVQASGGRHYFGQTWSLAASHRSRHTVWSINYGDTVTTTRSQFLLPSTIDTASLLNSMFLPTFPDPVERQLAVAAYLRATGLPASLANSVNYFSNRYMRQKQWQASAAFTGAHSSMILSLFDSGRTALSTQQADSALLGSSLTGLNDNTHQQGVTALLNYRLSSRSTANLTLAAVNSDSLSTGIVNNTRTVQLGVSRQFSRRVRAAIDVRHMQGGTGAGTGQNYRENAVAATLSMQL
jgi:uncharacterized protein (PEP-CTERM system associated)